MPTALEALNGQMIEVQGKIQGLFEKKDDQGEYDWTPEDADHFKDFQKKATDLRARIDRQQELEDAERKSREVVDRIRKPSRLVPGAGGDGSALAGDLPGGSPEGVHASASEILAKAVADHALQGHLSAKRPITVELKEFDTTGLVVERKTTMTTTAGFPPFSQRGPVQVPFALRRPMVGDLIRQDPTNQPSVIYMEETTFTNAAAAVAEGASKPESANAWTQRTVAVEVIATVLPVTEQQLEDVPAIEAIIRDRLTLMIMLTEENYLLNGTGTSPQIQGILTKSGVQSYAMGADDVDDTPADAILRGITKIRVNGFAEPSAVVLHPNDFLSIRLMKTADGLYIFGPPSEPGPTNLWGLDTVVTTAMTENTALVGAFNNPLYVHVSRRKGIVIDIGYVNDDFKKNQRTIRAETRVSQEIGRPSAFCGVTGV